MRVTSNWLLRPSELFLTFDTTEYSGSCPFATPVLESAVFSQSLGPPGMVGVALLLRQLTPQGSESTCLRNHDLILMPLILALPQGAVLP